MISKSTATKAFVVAAAAFFAVLVSSGMPAAASADPACAQQELGAQYLPYNSVQGLYLPYN